MLFTIFIIIYQHLHLPTTSYPTSYWPVTAVFVPEFQLQPSTNLSTQFTIINPPFWALQTTFEPPRNTSGHRNKQWVLFLWYFSLSLVTGYPLPKDQFISNTPATQVLIFRGHSKYPCNSGPSVKTTFVVLFFFLLWKSNPFPSTLVLKHILPPLFTCFCSQCS